MADFSPNVLVVGGVPPQVNNASDSGSPQPNLENQSPTLLPLSSAVQPYPYPVPIDTACNAPSLENIENEHPCASPIPPKSSEISLLERGVGEDKLGEGGSILGTNASPSGIHPRGLDALAEGQDGGLYEPSRLQTFALPLVRCVGGGSGVSTPRDEPSSRETFDRSCATPQPIRRGYGTPEGGLGGGLLTENTQSETPTEGSPGATTKHGSRGRLACLTSPEENSEVNKKAPKLMRIPLVM